MQKQTDPSKTFTFDEVAKAMPHVAVPTDLFLKLASIFRDPEIFLRLSLGELYTTKAECEKVIDQMLSQVGPDLEQHRLTNPAPPPPCCGSGEPS